MNHFATLIAARMAARKVIDPEYQDYYVYGLEIILANIVLSASILFVSIFLKQIPVSIFFVIAFAVLRFSFAGYHSKSYLHCYIISMMIYFVFIVAYLIVGEFDFEIYVSLAVLALATLIFVYINLPIALNRESKPTSTYQYMLFGGYFLGCLVVLLTPWNKVAFPIAYALFVTVVLVVAQKLTGGKTNEEKHNIPHHEDCR